MNNDKIVRMLAYNGRISVVCANITNLVEEARKVHDLSPVMTAVFGRLLTITSIMASEMKSNKDKITVVRQHDRQIVTGVVVNEKLQAPKDYRKSIRLEMHYCQKYGIDSHLQRRFETVEKIDNIKYCQSMLGKINYCLQLNGKDVEMKT